MPLQCSLVWNQCPTPISKSLLSDIVLQCHLPSISYLELSTLLITDDPFTCCFNTDHTPTTNNSTNNISYAMPNTYHVHHIHKRHDSLIYTRMTITMKLIASLMRLCCRVWLRCGRRRCFGSRERTRFLLQMVRNETIDGVSRCMCRRFRIGGAGVCRDTMPI